MLTSRGYKKETENIPEFRETNAAAARENEPAVAEVKVRAKSA